jgi:hypothetical protein
VRSKQPGTGYCKLSIRSIPRFASLSIMSQDRWRPSGTGRRSSASAQAGLLPVTREAMLVVSKGSLDLIFTGP